MEKKKVLAPIYDQVKNAIKSLDLDQQTELLEMRESLEQQLKELKEIVEQKL